MGIDPVFIAYTDGEIKIMASTSPETDGKGLLRWLACVLGWLVCAGMCLTLTVELEKWPEAYDMFFPAILLILFCNILLFLFIASRFGSKGKSFFVAIALLCAGEGLLLAVFYLLGRFTIGA